MPAPRKLIATQPTPAEMQRDIEREMAFTESARRSPTMIPRGAHPHVVEDGANFYSRLYRPHAKRWVRISVLIFFVVIPLLMILLSLIFTVLRPVH